MEIRDYGFLSDCQASALVSRDGSLDWLCMPRFDSPSLFGRLLDPDAGHWSIRPSAPFEATRSYVGDSLVLQTIFQTDAGRVALTDGLLFEQGSRDHEIGYRVPHVLVRQVEGIEGRAAMRLEFRPRFEYALVIPRIDSTEFGATAVAGPATLDLDTSVPLQISEASASADFEVAAGQQLEFRLRYRPTFEHAPDAAGGSLDDTVAGWESWLRMHSGYDGPYAEAVRRSALILQGLTYRPSGGIVAAATSSLPEIIGEGANWDYRFVWLRDLSLVLRALWVAACPDEVREFFRLISVAIGDVDDRGVPIVFRVDGSRDLSEHELPDLAGFAGSTPVRVGNDAWRQRQLDVLGEVVDAAHQLRDQLGDFPPALRDLLRGFADRAAATWQEPDAGMWEARDRERHYVSSKVMRWVALDRAIQLAPRIGEADVGRWSKARDALRADILERGWNERIGAFTGAYDSDELDASVLLMPLVEFLPADDPRMARTIRAVERELGEGAMVHRWRGDPNGFVICGYWLVECLAMLGETDAAHRRFDALTALANDLGILSEMADPRTNQALGNVPQAFSHIGLINAAYRFSTLTER